ncbi:MAG: glycosyltransferase [Blautia sp.]|nr:glycosyltransferase [Blautia sp.]MCM1200182.1 glycosyltransferase [Bacteroides fragilis]
MIPISVCLITRNEAENLDKCLKSLSPYPFEIVVVDTGSTDHSKEIARQYTDKVFDFTWINDFSAARNFSISRASHNMILVLDTDEFLVEFDFDRVQQLMAEHPKSVGLIKRLDYFEAGQEKHCQTTIIDRLFNRKYYHYERPIHEILVPAANIPNTSYMLPVTADHVGYIGSPEKLREKSMRDISLLLPEIEKDPGEPYYYFQMAQSYLCMREHEQAFSYFKMALERNPAPEEDYTRILVCNYGNMLLDSGKPQEALSLLSFYEYYGNNADYLCMIGLMYIQLNQLLKALPELVKALSAPARDSVEPRVISYYIGYIYESFQQKDIARHHYQRCGEFEPALEALKRINN